MSRALIAFIRNPERGKVKTRLAKSIGDSAALDVYCRLLAHTRTVCESVNARRFLFYADSIAVADAWPAALFSKHLQAAGDLGARMRAAFDCAFGQGCEKAVIIGSDCPQISPALLEEAFARLDRHDLVLGPAADGGYYLLGMNRLHPELFEAKAWSTPSVLADTLRDAHSLGLTVHLLTVLTDVDEERDLFAMQHLP